MIKLHINLRSSPILNIDTDLQIPLNIQTWCYKMLYFESSFIYVAYALLPKIKIKQLSSYHTLEKTIKLRVEFSMD